MASFPQGLIWAVVIALFAASGCGEDDAAEAKGGDVDAGLLSGAAGEGPPARPASDTGMDAGAEPAAAGSRRDAAPARASDAAASDASQAADTTDAARTAEDAAEPAADAAPAESHDGLVPLFVAYGHGGRTLVSCDDGRSFAGEHIFLDDGADHGPYSALGRMAYGRGVFVGAAGWGATGRLLVSDDGFDWQELPDAAYLDEGGGVATRGSGSSGVAFDGDVFVTLIGGRFFRSQDGWTWRRLADALPSTGSTPQLRSLGGGDGLLLLPYADQLLVSRDQAASWQAAVGYDAACAARLQRGGNIRVHGQDVVIAGRDGYVCASTDGGKRFGPAVPLSSWLGSFLWSAEDALLAIARPSTASGGARTVYRSPDGHAWSESPDVLDSTPAVMARSDAGTLVSIDGSASEVRRSTDHGRSWSRSTSTSSYTHGLTDLVFGHASPSSACPL